MKPHSSSYALLLTLAWVACAVLAALFPGNEHLNQVPACVPGYLVLRCLPWVRNLSLNHSLQFILPAGVTVIMVFILALGMDRVRVRPAVWWRAVLAVTAGFAALVLLALVREARLAESFARAAHKMRLDEPDRLVAYALFCLSSGLLLGSLLAFLYGGIERMLKPASPGSPAEGSPPPPSAAKQTPSAAGSRRST